MNERDVIRPVPAADSHSDSAQPPETIIIVHPKERRSKCTVAPLRGDSRFRFYKYPRRPPDLTGYVRLGIGGPELSAADANFGLLVLDGTWRWAEAMENAFAEVPVRTLPGLQTAYPRTSKVFADPAAGLATIEAVYAALRILGRDVDGVLASYAFAEPFLHGNAVFWQCLRQFSPEREPLTGLARGPGSGADAPS